MYMYQKPNLYFLKCQGSNLEIYTQFSYEKKWTKTLEKDALLMISKEMPETDAVATLSYIVSEIAKGKIVTLGGCRFKNSH